MFESVVAVLHDDDGTSLLEYALLTALVAAVAVSGFTLFGANTKTLMDNAALSIAG